MSTPAAKRRRIDTASQTLSKPFRSPFKTPFKSPPKNEQAQSTVTSTDQAQQVTPLAPKPTNSLLSNHARSPSLSESSVPKAGPRTKKTFTSPVAAAALNADPDIAPMLRAQRELEKQLKELKEELDTAEQARKIEADSLKKDPDGEIDFELVELVEKWKSASRQAAEELFGKVLNRVNSMGGPRAWKVMQKKQAENQGAWDQPEETNNDDDSDDEDAEEKKKAAKEEMLAQYGIDPETANEKSQRVKGLGDTGELPGQEDEFTMAIMLRTLNVDLDIIGYDRVQQRWI